MVETNQSDHHLDEFDKPRVQKDQEDINTEADLAKGCVNSFADKQNIASLSTARGAPSDIANDLMKAKNVEQNYEKMREGLRMTHHW